MIRYTENAAVQYTLGHLADRVLHTNPSSPTHYGSMREVERMEDAIDGATHQAINEFVEKSLSPNPRR